MRFRESKNPDEFISDLKYTEDSDSIRLTFRWPEAIGQAYVFKTKDAFDYKAGDFSGARLYTRQEYKKLGGFSDKKTPGVHVYTVFPFLRENGEDILIAQSDGRNAVTCLTGQVNIYFSLKEKKNLFGNGKLHNIMLSCEQPVDSDILCYVVKENGYPQNSTDGTVYFFGEPLRPGHPVNTQIKTGKNEFLRLFINDSEKEDLYSLKMKE